MQPNTPYRFSRDTKFNDLKVFLADSEFRSNPQGAFDARIVHPLGRPDESRTIPKWILDIWLEDGRIEQIKAWEPTKGEEFWAFGCSGSVELYRYDEANQDLIGFGNYFETKEEAETVVAQIANSLSEYHASKV